MNEIMGFMGFKLKSSISSHTWTWWLHHLFGRHFSCFLHNFPPEFPSCPPPPPSLVVVRSDCGVKVYTRAVVAAELMAEFPHHLICNSDSFFIGQMVPVLSEADELKLGQRYFLLPKHFFQSVLSFAAVACIAAASADRSSLPAAPCDRSTSARYCSNEKAAACGKPAFDVVKTSSGSIQIKVSDFIFKSAETTSCGNIDGEEELLGLEKKVDVIDECWKYCDRSVICTTAELRKDYSQLVGWRRSAPWRPKLDAIKEERGSKFRRLGATLAKKIAANEQPKWM